MPFVGSLPRVRPPERVAPTHRRYAPLGRVRMLNFPRIRAPSPAYKAVRCRWTCVFARHGRKTFTSRGRHCHQVQGLGGGTATPLRPPVVARPGTGLPVPGSSPLPYSPMSTHPRVLPCRAHAGPLPPFRGERMAVVARQLLKPGVASLPSPSVGVIAGANPHISVRHLAKVSSRTMSPPPLGVSGFQGITLISPIIFLPCDVLAAQPLLQGFTHHGPCPGFADASSVPTLLIVHRRAGPHDLSTPLTIVLAPLAHYGPGFPGTYG